MDGCGTGQGVVTPQGARRLREHLARLYGDEAAATTMQALLARLDRFVDSGAVASRSARLFDETDVVLACYGDQVHEQGRPPLESLHRFLSTHAPQIPAVHLLPHYPSTSDDGFAVADFTAVDPALGTWSDVSRLASDFDLMLDAVVNHTSASHPWFTGWVDGDPQHRDFYLDVDPATDLSSVTRPRTTPVLTRTGTDRWAWSTFSADQVDLNYRNPAVLLAVTEVLLEYVARGARLLRLDAIAFLWKQVGTSCIHLPETHEVIRFWRTVLDLVAPGTLLVTETNVPHDENLTYFGDGTDEAHLVYQFALPPLTLAAFHQGDTSRLGAWVRTLQTPSPTTSFLNFLASHDGIGLRAAEGLLSPVEIESLGSAVTGSDGEISYRGVADGDPVPYELNSVYLDALARPGQRLASSMVRDRFLAAHSIMFALAGVPLLYFHSLVGSRNWADGARQTGRARVINRQRLARHSLEAELADPTSRRRQVLDGLLALVAARTGDPAFHPSAAQSWVGGPPGFFAVQRSAPDDRSCVICVTDVTGRGGRFRARPPDRLPKNGRLVDLLDGSEHLAEPDGAVDVPVPPFGVRWLRCR
jgi:sucrose phosphorylase